MTTSTQPAEIRSPRVKVQTSVGTVTDGASVSAQLRDFARATGQVYPTPKEDTPSIPYKEIAQVLGSAQTRALQLDNARMRITITGGGDDLVFQGFEVQPSMTVGVGYFSPGIAGLHAASLVTRLDFSLYAGSLSHLEDVQVKDIVKAMREIIRRQVEYWRSKVYPTLDKADKETARQLHENNTGPLRIIDRILANSAPHSIDGLEALAKQLPMIRLHIIGMVVEYLSSDAMDSWTGFRELLTMFGLVYAPDIGDSNACGRVISIKAQLQKPTTRTKLDGLTFNPALALPELPITHVLVSKVPMPAVYRAHDNDLLVPNKINRVNIRYPKDRITGRAFRAPVPAYLSPVFMGLGQRASLGAGMLPGQARDGQEKLRQLVVKSTDVIHSFLEGYAKSVFEGVQLQNSTAFLSLPLSADWKVGDAYEVGIQGASLFVGLLAAVSHTVSGKSGAPSASTQLSFSHVQWGNFRLV